MCEEESPSSLSWETLDDCEKDSDTKFLLSKDHSQRPKRSSHLLQKLSWTLNAVSVIVCLGLLLHISNITRGCRTHCVEKFNSYSPVLEAIDQDYQDIRFKYSLWYKSPFKGPPTPSVEAAWQDIMQYGQISVTAYDILRIGHNLTSVKYPDSVGGGYLATAMGTHAIHCLHYIWQDHYIDVSPDVQSKKEEVPEMYERHYEHCVDYIRQYLMCKFDTTIMPFN